MDYTTKMLTLLLGIYNSTGAVSIDSGMLGEIRFATYKGENGACVVMVHAYEGSKSAYIQHVSSVPEGINPVFSGFLKGVPDEDIGGMNFETLIIPSHPSPLSNFIRLDQSADYGMMFRGSYSGRNDDHLMHCDASSCTCQKIF